jgi:hypothetical protein
MLFYLLMNPLLMLLLPVQKLKYGTLSAKILASASQFGWRAGLWIIVESILDTEKSWGWKTFRLNNQSSEDTNGARYYSIEKNNNFDCIFDNEFRDVLKN